MLLREAVERIVILEDSDDDFDTMCEAVRHLDFAVEICRVTDGDACVAFLARNTVDLPSLVIMDLNAPCTGGREALRVIKLDPALRRIPVVIMTTSTNPRDVDLCYLYGANAYHTKSIRYPDHLRSIESILRYWLSEVICPSRTVPVT